MVHTRLNERETNPNLHINFITALPTANVESASQEDARQLLRALAAQVRPVMKMHGFSVNSLEEYEFNAVFAGRNWNSGETVELVLRKPTGLFLPISSLMSTFCHELAHIKHMNHGPAFQALWKQLSTEVRNLQNKGYYGDGYWSSGTRLIDSGQIAGNAVEYDEFPEYMCGGAQTRTRPTSLRRRRRRTTKAGPSNQTGAQTSKKRRAGARVTAAGLFVGEGTALNAGADEETKKKETVFRKRATSKRAREERALAADRRIRALQAQSQVATASTTIPPPIKRPTGQSDGDSETDNSDLEEIHETDQDRRRTLLDTMGEDALEKTSWGDFADDFAFHAATAKPKSRPNQKQDSSRTELGITISSDEEACDPISGLASSSKFIASGSSKSNAISVPNRKGKGKVSDIPDMPPVSSRTPKASTTNLGLGKMVQTEINLRKKESLGLAPVNGSRKLGGSGAGKWGPGVVMVGEKDTSILGTISDWSCLVCTLDNHGGHLTCLACATPRRDSDSALVTGEGVAFCP